MMSSDNLANGLRSDAAQLDVNLLDDQIEKLFSFLTLLQKWNHVYNLTSITQLPDMVSKHVVDSLAVAKFIDGDRVIDVGTGGGLPGIPLAILYPEKQFTLLDSNVKKTRFLQQVKAQLKLTNVTVVHQRVEQFEPTDLFTTVVTRAFSSLQQMLECCAHLLSEDGIFVAMKGVYPSDEIEQLAQGFSVIDVTAVNVPKLDAQRHVVRIRKEK